MFFLDHIWLIPLLPAFGATAMFFFGRKLQKQAVDAVCVGVVVLAFLLACGAVWQYTGYAHDNPGKPYEKILYTWLGSDTGHLNFVKKDGSPAPFHADAGFLLDPLSAIWLLFVTGVGMLIHIYSTGYMAHEGGYYRFFGYHGTGTRPATVPYLRSHHYGSVPAAVRRRLRQVGTDSTLCLAARCDGRAHAGFGSDPRRDHGHRRCVHGGALECAVCTGAKRDEDGRHHRRADRDIRCVNRSGAERHQACAGILYRFPVGIHVPRARRWRLCGGRVSRLHSRVFQSAAVPRLRLSDPCNERRAGHAQHG